MSPFASSTSSKPSNEPRRPVGRGLSWFLTCALLLAGSAAPLSAQRAQPKADAATETPAAQAASGTPAPAAATSKSTPPASATSAGTVTVAGRALAYRAIAARLTLNDEGGKPAGDIFHVAYTVPDQEARPVTFVFNGGPGAASAFLHLAAMGPRIVTFAVDGSARDPGTVVENPDTWLPFTDLVFVDPIATGYSRARSTEAEKAFLGTEKDAEQMTEFVRLWLARNARTTSPVYIAGESYGSFRASLLAARLVAIGTQLKGLVLISPALDFALIRAGRRALLPRVLVLPSLAAVHRELQTGRPATPAELADVETFARTTYLTHLAGRLSRNPAIEARIAQETGLPEPLIARHFARVSANLYLSHRERETGRSFSRYDGTVSAPAPRPSGASNFDPVLEHMEAALTSASTSYARTTLGYRTDLPYVVLNHGIFAKWSFGRHNRQGFANALDALQDARTRQPRLRILVASGTTDLVTTYAAAQFMMDQLEPIEGAAEPVVKAYPGGHMMYLRAESRRALTEDARKLYADEPAVQ